jgi:hypothetical protein
MAAAAPSYGAEHGGTAIAAAAGLALTPTLTLARTLP